jgi:hypothetical protein
VDYQEKKKEIKRIYNIRCIDYEFMNMDPLPLKELHLVLPAASSPLLPSQYKKGGLFISSFAFKFLLFLMFHFPYCTPFF